MRDDFYMSEAIAQAKRAVQNNEVPIGAVLVHHGQIIAAEANATIRKVDPTAHAEMLVLRNAGKALKTERFSECDLYVTLEPCPMCAQAIAFARIKRLYFGAYDLKGGGVDHGPRIFEQPSCHHKPEIWGGIKEKECGEILRSFFAQRRATMV